MGGASAKRKGSRIELEVAKALDAIPGVSARKTPLSGAMGGVWSGDIRCAIRSTGEDFVVEVKARKNGFKVLDGWLEGNDVLVVRADRSDPRVYLTWDAFAGLLEAAAAPRQSIAPGGGQT